MSLFGRGACMLLIFVAVLVNADPPGNQNYGARDLRVADPESCRNVAVKSLAIANAGMSDVRVVSVTMQFGARLRYFMQIRGTQGGQEKDCQLDVVSRPDLPANRRYEVLKLNCTTHCPSIPGGISCELPNPGGYLDLALRVIALTNSPLTDIQVTSVRTQVVAGTKYYMKIKAKNSGYDQSCDLEMWSRPWLNGTEGFQVLKFECNSSCPSIPGGISCEIPNPQQYLDVALRAVSVSNKPLTDVQVTSVRTQVVEGTKYYMKIKAKTGPEDHHCDIQIWSRPWLNGTDGFQVLKFECNSSCPSIPGGISCDLPNPQQYLDVVLRALTLTNSPLTDVQVISVRTQVVAGTKYYIKIKAKAGGFDQSCDLEIWSRPWLNGTEGFQVLKFDCSNSCPVMPGGISCEKPNPQQYLDLAIRAASLSNTAFTNIQVTSVRTQVVEGTKYYMKIKAKTGPEDQTCDLEIWSRPWLNSTEGFQVLKFQCNRSCPSIPGGISCDLPNPEQYLDVALRALTLTNSPLTGVQVLSVRTQVVAGTKYYIKIKAKNNEYDESCDLEIWSRPWLNGTEGFQVLKFQCTGSCPVIPGGISCEQPNPQQYLDVALRAVSVSNKPLTDVQVTSVRTQAVSGIKYYMKIKAKLGSEDQTCDIQVVSSPWLNGTEGFQVLKFDCNSSCPSIPGGISCDLPNPQQYLDVALRALTLTNSPLTDVQVTSVRTQVVAGTKYYMKIKAKNSGYDESCDLEIWSRPWLNGTEGFQVLKFQCNGSCPVIPGGISCEEPNPQQYLDVALRAVSASNKPLTDVQVTSVRTQAVSGIKYYMKIKAKLGSEDQTCDLQIVSRPWLNGTEGFQVLQFACTSRKAYVV